MNLHDDIPNHLSRHGLDAPQSEKMEPLETAVYILVGVCALVSGVLMLLRALALF
jgi:hypothetical protein